MNTKRLRIHGLVQGVGFRWALSYEARKLGVTGWVRNRSDGSVEAVVAGEDAALCDLIAWAHRGPRGARVTRVEIGEADGEFFTFEQHPSV